MSRDRAQELRAARTLFERAARDGVSMEEARRRIHEERWQAADSLCGTRAPAFSPAPMADDGDDGLAWWQR